MFMVESKIDDYYYIVVVVVVVVYNPGPFNLIM